MGGPTHFTTAANPPRPFLAPTTIGQALLGACHSTAKDRKTSFWKMASSHFQASKKQKEVCHKGIAAAIGDIVFLSGAVAIFERACKITQNVL